MLIKKICMLKIHKLNNNLRHIYISLTSPEALKMNFPFLRFNDHGAVAFTM